MVEQSGSEPVKSKAVQKTELPQMTVAEFLESSPPSVLCELTDLCYKITHSQSHGIAEYKFRASEIQLYCVTSSCNGPRFFRTTNSQNLVEKKPSNFYVTYTCSNCLVNQKVFSLCATRSEKAIGGTCFKYGESPPYGPPTPPRLLKLIGPDRDLFLKGRRSENKGLGIGAFGYYRRVLESQKNRIIDEIIKVSEKLSASAEVLSALNEAKTETQFSKALSSISIPQALYINGHNPLTLLYAALSDGLHEKSDEYCLELAHSIRVVLAELSDRLSQALKDEAELKGAIARILDAKKPALDTAAGPEVANDKTECS